MTRVRALLVGRFQPPHRGHLHALRAASRRYDAVFVAVGSAQRSHELRNPFTVGERFEMLQAALAEARLRNVQLFPVPDIHRHAAWAGYVASLLPRFDVVVTNNPLTRRLFARAGYRVRSGALWRPDACSGTAIRARWTRGEEATDLLPPAVERVARRIGAAERVQVLAREARRGRR